MNDFSPSEMTDNSDSLPCEQPVTGLPPTPIGGLRVYQAICSLTEALSKIGISKERKNVQQGYAFRGIDDVYAAISPLLARYKLCILPRVVNRVDNERPTKGGSVMFHTALTVEFDFISAIDGSRHTIITVGEAQDSGDKAGNKALSAAYKYACFMAFCIPVEGDGDADAATPEETMDSVDASEAVRRSGLPQDRVVTWLENKFRAAPGTLDLTKLTRAEFRVLADKLPELSRRYAEETMKLGGVSA